MQSRGDMVLYYPEWETTSHSSTGSAVELAGLRIEAGGRTIAWRRDPVDVHAFHIDPPSGTRLLTISFDFLPLRSAALLRDGLVVVPWQRVLLYPAGWYARNVTVAADVNLQAGLDLFSSLHMQQMQPDKGTYSFAPETLDRLVDSPLYAAKCSRRYQVKSGAQPVFIDFLADSPEKLALKAAAELHLREMVRQTQLVFGEAPFRQYDAIVSLDDDLSPGGGQEHLEEGENNLPSDYLTNGSHQLNNDDLIVHEYVHAWNGCYRQPAGLWSPDFNRPTDPSLLWMYEGQTEFWGRVIAARSGLRTLQETLDKLALDADLVANRTGREWKTLADSNLDVLYMPGHTVAWRDWQRREDYYAEGVLLWLDVDARLRELTHGRANLDHFAQRFFATHGRTRTVSTYDQREICTTLNQIAAENWQSFLQRHLETHSDQEAMAGLQRAGWRLTYTSTTSETFRQAEREAGVTNLDSSIGMQVRSDGTIRSVVWNGPAFRAGLAPGLLMSTVDGRPYTSEALVDAVAASISSPVVVTFKQSSGSFTIPYTGPLRYPHLERIPEREDRLTPLLLTK